MIYRHLLVGFIVIQNLMLINIFLDSFNNVIFHIFKRKLYHMGTVPMCPYRFPNFDDSFIYLFNLSCCFSIILEYSYGYSLFTTLNFAILQ